MGIRDDELMARWVEYGVFSPINRLHSTDNPFNGKEPWKFDKITQGVMKITCVCVMEWFHICTP